MQRSRRAVRQLARFILVLGVTSTWNGVAAAFEAELSLDQMRSMHYRGPVPELGKLSPAMPEQRAAPKDADSYTSAYRNGDGCVIFFEAMTSKTHDLAFSWRGSTCDGTPVSGPGALQVQYREDAEDGSVTRVMISEGSFSGGYLSGQGKKANLLFDAQGRMKEDTFEFIGQFGYGLLDGPAMRIWYGAASARPSLKVISGTFKKGETTKGWSVISVLHPYPGAEALSQQVIYSDQGDGKPYVSQGEANGKLWFPGASEAWLTFIHSLDGEYGLKSASMIRLVGGKLQALASCDEWQPRSDGWHCEGDKISRFIELHDPRAKLAEGVASKSPFVLNPGASVEANPFRFLADGTPVKIGLVSILMDWWKKDDGPAVSTCNAAMTLCERKELLNAALWAKPVDKRLIRTTIRWNDGKWISLRGSTADADWNGNVTRVDSRCSQFSPGLEGLSSDCLSGEVVLDDGVKWRGGYTLSTMGRHPVVSGFGRLTFKDGRWVEGITKSEGEWISLSRCGYEVLDDSVDPGVACCRLRGQTVVFDR